MSFFRKKQLSWANQQNSFRESWGPLTRWRSSSIRQRHQQQPHPLSPNIPPIQQKLQRHHLQELQHTHHWHWHKISLILLLCWLFEEIRTWRTPSSEATLLLPNNPDLLHVNIPSVRPAPTSTNPPLSSTRTVLSTSDPVSPVLHSVSFTASSIPNANLFISARPPDKLTNVSANTYAALEINYIFKKATKTILTAISPNTSIHLIILLQICPSLVYFMPRKTQSNARLWRND